MGKEAQEKMAGFGNSKESKIRQQNTAQKNQQMNLNALFKIALDNHVRGDIENAERCYRKIINSGNPHVASISNLAVLCQSSQRTEEAIELYKKAIHLNPNNPNTYTNFGSLYKDLGNLDKALAYTLKSQELKPDSPENLLNLGCIYKDLGNLDQALASTLKSLELKPDNPIAHLNLGGIYKDLGNIDQALDSMLKSLELKPDNPTAHLNLSGIHKDIGNIDQALASTLKSLELKPDNPIAHLNLGGIYKDLGNLDQALASTLKSLELKEDNPNAHMSLGSIYQNLGNLDQALASTLRSLELKPDNHTAHMNLGRIYQNLGNLDQALASTLESLELKPDNHTAHMNLGSIYKNLGNLDQALASTLRSLELKPDNPDAHMNLGGIYKNLGNLDQALASTLKSLELKPDNSDAQTNLGEIYFETAKYKEAEEAFDAAIKLSRQQKVSFTTGKAACRFINKDYDNAIELIRSLPSDKYAWRNTPIPREAKIKSIAHALQNKESLCNQEIEAKGKNTADKGSLIKVTYREVEDDLINELYSIKTRKLTETNDARTGSGSCTDFKLFSHRTPYIKQLKDDLRNIIEEALHKETCSLIYDSFFNIFKAGSGARPHDHIKSQDRKFDLWKHKYSLVYYIDPGDQNCDQPGILKIHGPELTILPRKGMIVIMPATLIHSSCYGGQKDRLMVGANFYAFYSSEEKKI